MDGHPDLMRPALLLLLLACCCVAQPLAAEDLRTFGFDQDTDGDQRPDLWRNLKHTLEYWQDPPAARVVTQDGRQACRLVLRRGNKGVEHHVAVPLPPERQHRLQAELLTRHLVRGGGSLEVVFLDAKGQSLGLRRTRPLDAPAWTTLVLPLVDVPQGTRALRLRCLLIGRGDVRGEAFFGPLELHGSPRRAIATPWAVAGRFHPVRRLRPHGAPPHNVRLALRISGAQPGSYRLQLELKDLSGRPVTAQDDWRLEQSYGTHDLDLIIAQSGFYSGWLHLLGMPGKRLHFSEPIELAVYDERTTRHWGTAGPVGLALREPRHADRWPEAAELVAPAWVRITLERRQAMQPNAGLHAVLRRLADQGVQSMGLLHGDQLVAGWLAGRDDAIAALAGALRSYGGHIRRWQLGGDAEGRAWAAADRSGFLARLPALARSASVAARFGLPDTAGADFQVQATPAGRAGAGDVVVLRMPPRALARRPKPGALADLSRRLLERRAADPAALLLLSRAPDESWLDPARAHPELLVTRAVNGFLGPAPRVTAIDESVRVFRQGGRTVLAIWSEGPRKPVELYPGRGAQAWNLLGSPIPLGGPGNLDTPVVFRVMAPVGAAPYYITGVDTPFLLTQLSAAFDSPVLRSAIDPQQLVLSLTNHFPDRRRFLVGLGFPEGYSASAREHSLVLEGGESGKLAIPLRLGPLAYAGPAAAELFVHVVEGDRRRFFRRIVPLRVESALQVDVRRKGAGLQVRVTNGTAETLNVVLRLALPTGLRESWAVDFPPGATKSRELPVEDAAALAGQTVEVSLRDTSGGRFLRARAVVR